MTQRRLKKTKYHTLYYANFLNRLLSTEKKHRQDNQVSEAMAESFNYIENNDDSQFTLKEFRDVLTGRYGSERLIDVLYSLGFVASYGDTVQFKISTAYYPQPRILSSESGALVQYVGDNAYINVQTLDACGQYNGQGFFNALRYESDLDEDCTFDPEILQDLETNILDDENNENELDIFE
ncbi:hypothetical protein TNCV_1379331 [Trichonephila clavipes]|nr:hypothetical protein TNCV_1379331 [Trichonephila clavipes]